MAQKQESPAGSATGEASNCLDDCSKTSTTARSKQAAARAVEAAINPQAAIRALEAGLACLPHPVETAFTLRRRLAPPERIWLAFAAILSLDASDAEELAESVLHDLRAGPPIPPFTTLRDEAVAWAAFASRGERCYYIAAAWGELGDDDRSRFLRRAI